MKNKLFNNYKMPSNSIEFHQCSFFVCCLRWLYIAFELNRKSKIKLMLNESNWKLKKPSWIYTMENQENIDIEWCQWW
jgi:hypothetical protein